MSTAMRPLLEKSSRKVHIEKQCQPYSRKQTLSDPPNGIPWAQVDRNQNRSGARRLPLCKIRIFLGLRLFCPKDREVPTKVGDALFPEIPLSFPGARAQICAVVCRRPHCITVVRKSRDRRAGHQSLLNSTKTIFLRCLSAPFVSVGTEPSRSCRRRSNRLRADST